MSRLRKPWPRSVFQRNILLNMDATQTRGNVKWRRKLGVIYSWKFPFQFSFYSFTTFAVHALAAHTRGWNETPKIITYNRGVIYVHTYVYTHRTRVLLTPTSMILNMQNDSNVVFKYTYTHDILWQLCADYLKLFYIFFNNIWTLEWLSLCRKKIFITFFLTMCTYMYVYINIMEVEISIKSKCNPIF